MSLAKIATAIVANQEGQNAGICRVLFTGSSRTNPGEHAGPLQLGVQDKPGPMAGGSGESNESTLSFAALPSGPYSTFHRSV